MMKPFTFVLASTLFLSLSDGVIAQQSHTHTHDHSGGVDLPRLDDGWVVLEEVLAAIRNAVASNNIDALHDLSSQLPVVADSLGKLVKDVPQANQLRFTSSVNQLRTLSDRLHVAHEEGNSAAAQQMVPQLDGVVQLLMVSAEAN